MSEGEVPNPGTVYILGVNRTGCSVVVDLYGGFENACGAVTLRQPTEEEAEATAGHLIRWRDGDQPVTIDRRGGQVTIRKDVRGLL